MKTAPVVLALLACLLCAPALADPITVTTHGGKSSFILIHNGHPAALLVDPSADSAVLHAADGFRDDLNRVSGHAAARLSTPASATGDIVVAGVLGQSPLIDALVASGKISATDISGQWEAYRQVVVDHPWPNVAPNITKALVIIGSDRRGAVYGLYDISEKIGVSPWYWWADIPVTRKANLYLTAGSHTDAPKVRYRGFFINDEAPAFSTWTQNKFGGANAKAYAHVFDLLLRLKGNYIWPAMWAPRAFNADDPQNIVLADSLGVVMGTSHHEPMTRAQDEWHRNTDQGVTGGKWDYATNAANLRAFWRGGIERMMSKGNGKPYDSLVTIGMRGDGDEAMTEGTATQLLETIVTDQRQIIADVTGKPADQTPQVWALYKEVQDYYDHGMKVPDDVILLFADDNWGQIRRLPTTDIDRKGGFGVYYHFDYVGAPRNYKWLDTVQIEKTWQQMDLAYAKNARSLWIVNVGDIKPEEFPISFFMKQAWNPQAMTPAALSAYPHDWATATFGPAQADAIANLVTRYSQLAARRKPELVNADSFKLGYVTPSELNGGDFAALLADWQSLEADMRKVRATLPAAQHDAFFELVEHPISALSNLYELYYDLAWNKRLAAKGDPRANAFADRAEAAYKHDQQLTDAYHALNHGKWDGMMLQTHIGYTNWQQPDQQTMPTVTRVPGEAPPIAFATTTPPTNRDLISIEAPDYIRAVSGHGLTWQIIPNLGRTSGAVLALPQGGPATTPADNVRLDYAISVARPGDLTVQLYLVPTLDVTGNGTLRIGLSLDDGPVQTLTDQLTPAPNATTTQAQRDWNAAVINNARILQASFPATSAGAHTLKVWRLDDNVVLQKLVASTAPIPDSYLGPSTFPKIVNNP